MKVSVILPSLNVKQYIRECVESVINQTLQDIEIICVDANSTDGTLEILREYAQKDSRIKIITSNQKSYGYQMNLGMAAATGEYVGIVETDDYVPCEMYEELYQVAVENDVDFVKADFYRFTGQGETLSKAYYKLTDDVSSYNKVIHIKHSQNIFGFVMNTWSGIYKREFLERNHIRHNETPGASFQDNGFWFQTLMYSERAYFCNKPYYMNRRDNEGSSVFSKDKVYCICDEYQFIYNIISKNQELLENFGFTFGIACFRAYRGNLSRIGDEYKKEFLKKWSEDFRNLQDKGLLDLDRFDAVDRKMLLSIIQNPNEYYANMVVKETEFYKEVISHKNIIIFGAGMIGKQILDTLLNMENEADVRCFAVSKKEENYAVYKGICIYDIRELLAYRESGYVIIGTTAFYHEEIKMLLRELGFKNVVAMPM